MSAMAMTLPADILAQDTDWLRFIVVGAIILISALQGVGNAIAKKIRENKESETRPGQAKPPEWTVVADADDVRRKISRRKAPQARQPAQPAPVPPPPRPVPRQPAPPPAAPTARRATAKPKAEPARRSRQSSSGSTAPKRKAPVRPITEEETVRLLTDAVEEVVESQVSQDLRQDWSVTGLRKAILVREILGPPLALRDPAEEPGWDG